MKYYKVRYPESGNMYIIRTNTDGSANIIKSILSKPKLALDQSEPLRPHDVEWNLKRHDTIELTTEEDLFIELL